jgi:hypothetical protein
MELSGILNAWVAIQDPSVKHAQSVLTSMVILMEGVFLAKTNRKRMLSTLLEQSKQHIAHINVTRYWNPQLLTRTA